MTITNWKAATGARLGTFDLTMPSGMTLVNCSAVNGKDGQFIGLPQRSWKTLDGETKYAACVKIEDRAVQKKFDAQVLEALREEGHIL